MIQKEEASLSREHAALGFHNVLTLRSLPILEDLCFLLVDGLADQDIVALRAGERTVDLVTQIRRLVGRVARLDVFDRRLLEIARRPVVCGLISLHRRLRGAREMLIPPRGVLMRRRGLVLHARQIPALLCFESHWVVIVHRARES